MNNNIIFTWIETKSTTVGAGGADENVFAIRWQNGYGSFRKMAERLRGRCASCRTSPSATGERGRFGCRPMDRGRTIARTRQPRSHTPRLNDGFARFTATFRRSHGITLYGHKTNGTTRLAETRHKPATAAERIPNGKRYQRRRRAPPTRPPFVTSGGGAVTCPSRRDSGALGRFEHSVYAYLQSADTTAVLIRIPRFFVNSHRHDLK